MGERSCTEVIVCECCCGRLTIECISIAPTAVERTSEVEERVQEDVEMDLVPGSFPAPRRDVAGPIDLP